ncbi:TetR family transcriptional regulator [Rathayibacter sp. VKM Ac-2803]|uniref:TetR/AcrR family transcriptional regulator n=1 Tax=unclassified Rathayibacter TaxID=2609250 RepID=UPI00135C311E|nr:MULTISPECIES: TetR/AcrR family transcriptional regulator [unclassified Rathayibacter]MWV48091.1 TetR family transcriptional regulator [Rathayibacter sp. VKM Ac-2803]MWV59416.1 TetR family transcriptional regulator [Rathayibacter sp. VKM Ac-2754]
MTGESPDAPPRPVGRPRRSQESLLAAAAQVFVESGVDAPVRDIAARAGVGVGTVYRHFPTRPELVVAVYRHQVEACAEAGPRLLAESSTAEEALRAWVAMFVDFLVTKHGLAGALQGDSAGSDALHRYFVDRLVPVFGSLLDAARAGIGHDPALDGYALLRGVGNLCIGAAGDPGYDAGALVQTLISGALAPRH